MEKWIPGYEGLYKATSEGEIYSSISGIYLKLTKDRLGYMRVQLKRRTYKVHRLIAETFLDDFYDKPQVNHLDGDKSNNNLENLEMTTISENLRHAFNTGLIRRKKGELHNSNKLFNDDVSIIRELYHKKSFTQKQLGLIFGVGQPHISTIIRKAGWSHI